LIRPPVLKASFISDFEDKTPLAVISSTVEILSTTDVATVRDSSEVVLLVSFSFLESQDNNNAPAMKE
jgi:hypothetical protein